MPGGQSNDQKSRTLWRNECYTGKSKDSKYTSSIKEPGLIDRWPKFLHLQVKLPDPGVSAALFEMRRMCPGEPASSDEIEKLCKETPFHTPLWQGRTPQTNIPERILAPAEVEVINNTYLELNTAFMVKREGQAAGAAIAEAEQNITAQNLKAQELILEVRWEMNGGFHEIKGVVETK